MPLPATEVADILNDELRKKGGDIITIPWSTFYEIAERQRMKPPFQDEVKNEAQAKYQLLVGYGLHVVVVCHDRNFRPS
jgi:hypothetical protein